LLLVPFLDRAGTGRRSAAFGVLGSAAVAYMVGMTAWGYRSWTPVYAVVGTLAVLVVLGVGTRGGGRSMRP
jgi:hypothetical protein